MFKISSIRLSLLEVGLGGACFVLNRNHFEVFVPIVKLWPSKHPPNLVVLNKLTEKDVLKFLVQRKHRYIFLDSMKVEIEFLGDESRSQVTPDVCIE